MKQKKLLALTLSQLRQLYRHELPELDELAARSGDEGDFRQNLLEHLAAHPQAEGEACRQLRLLAEHDGRTVFELSTGEQLPVSTLSLLFRFLTGQSDAEMETDVFVDL